MKRINLLSVLLVFFQFFISNISSEQNISYGIKGGLNYSGISGGSYRATKMKTGFNIYAFADFINLKNFSLSGEAGYTQKGFRAITYNYSFEPMKLDSENTYTKLGYIDISVLGKLKIPIKSVIPYLLAGLSFGLKVSDSVYPLGDEKYDAYDLYFMVKEFKTKSFGMKVGLGTEVNIFPKINLIIEGRYNFDFTVSYDSPESQVAVLSWGNNSNGLKNNVFEFMIGAKF